VTASEERRSLKLGQRAAVMERYTWRPQKALSLRACGFESHPPHRFPDVVSHALSSRCVRRQFSASRGREDRNRPAPPVAG
jgi:hypothetical protein